MDKILITIVGLFATLAAFNNIKTKENYTTAWGLSNRVKTSLVEVDPKSGAMQSAKGFGNNVPRGGGNKRMSNLNSQGHEKGSFVSYPSLESNLPPRSNGFVNYGANVKYNMPAPKHMASDFKQMTNTCSINPADSLSSCGSKKTSKNTTVVKTSKNTTDVKTSQNDVMNAMPVGDMRSTSVDGSVNNVMHYQNFIRANTRSRLQGLADPIRGDLPIKPDNCGWFRPSVSPNVDLKQGALAVIAGKNESSHTFNSLVYPSSGGSMSALGGIDISQPDERGLSGLNQIMGEQGRTAMADITFSSF